MGEVIFYFLGLQNHCRQLVCVLVKQLCPNLCDPMDCSSPGSSVHGISQARILEWVSISFSRGSSQPRDQTHVSCTAGKFFTAEPPGKPHCLQRKSQRLSPPQKKLEIISEVGKVTGYQINIYVSIVFL